MKKYTVVARKTKFYSTSYAVTAADEEEALRLAEEMYDEDDLCYDDYEVDFEVPYP